MDCASAFQFYELHACSLIRYIDCNPTLIEFEDLCQPFCLLNRMSACSLIKFSEICQPARLLSLLYYWIDESSVIIGTLVPLS